MCGECVWEKQWDPFVSAGRIKESGFAEEHTFKVEF